MDQILDGLGGKLSPPERDECHHHDDCVHGHRQLDAADAEMGDELAHSIFEAHHALVRDAIRERGGEELQWLGDGLVAGFASAAEAVACAIAVQEETERKGGEHGLRIRIGINVGEMLHDDEGCGYFGTPVVTAKRLCDVARPGEILCSGTVAGLLAGRSRFRFRDLGLMSLKGVAEPLPVREVIYDSPPAAAVREQHLGATAIPPPGPPPAARPVSFFRSSP